IRGSDTSERYSITDALISFCSSLIVISWTRFGRAQEIMRRGHAQAVLASDRKRSIFDAIALGETQSASIISTASSETDGLAFALSGDVALPSAPADSGHLVLLDRFGTNVVSWIDPATAEVVSQLPVGTGFESNPQDYVEFGERAFIS